MNYFKLEKILIIGSKSNSIECEGGNHIYYEFYDKENGFLTGFYVDSIISRWKAELPMHTICEHTGNPYNLKRHIEWYFFTTKIAPGY